MRKRDIPAFALSAAAHALLLMAPLLWMRTPHVGVPGPAKPRAMAVVLVPPEDPQFAGLNPVPDDSDDPPFDRPDRPLSLGHFTIDVTKIAKRAKVLFPFLTPGLSLELFALRRQDDPLRPLENPFKKAPDRQPDAAPPLSLSPPALQAIVDRSWARRDRWPVSQPVWALADRHDPDAGDLPRLLRAYGEQDMGQYYYDARASVRDPRFWTEMALAADHVDFIGFIRRYVSAHPSTRATTELLFILDKIAEGSRNILETLRTTDAPGQLEYTRENAPDAYRLAGELQQYYEDVLRTKGLRTPEDISAAYGRTRLEVLNGILRTTPHGYRAGDARFLIGTVYWRQLRYPDAMASWCQMTVDSDEVYADTARGILAAIEGSAACRATTTPTALERAVNLVLDRQEEHSWDFQFDRLRQFGYRVDTFWREGSEH
jgi:hypothetical protein